MYRIYSAEKTALVILIYDILIKKKFTNHTWSMWKSSYLRLLLCIFYNVLFINVKK